MTNTEAAALALATWTPACLIEVGQTTADRGSLLARPQPLGSGLARFEFVLGPVDLPLDCTLPVLRF